MLVTFLIWIPLTSFLCSRGILRYIYMYLPLYITWWDLRYPPTIYLPSYPCLSPLSGYYYTEVYPRASKLTIYNNVLVCSLWYTSISLSQGLNRIYLSLLFPQSMLCYSQTGLLYLYLNLNHTSSALRYKSCKNLSTYLCANIFRVQSSVCG